MFVGVGDVDEHSSKKLEGVHELGIVGVVSGFGLVDDELGFWMKVEPGRVHRGAHEIAGEPVNSLGVVGVDGGVIVNAETRITPRQE